MTDLLKVNVNEHTEKKGQLTYLSWAWAWAEVLKADPTATWVVHTYGPQGSEQPCMWIGETAMVHTSVTVNGLRRECMLPVMDHKNNAMKNPDSRKVSDAIMRCMTKAISMHGLGLYIYAGEDLPEGEEPAGDKLPASVRHSPTQGAMEEVQDEERRLYLQTLGSVLDNLVVKGEVDTAYKRLLRERLDDTEYTALWECLKTKPGVRAALKKHADEIKAAAKAQKETA